MLAEGRAAQKRYVVNTMVLLSGHDSNLAPVVSNAPQDTVIAPPSGYVATGMTFPVAKAFSLLSTTISVYLIGHSAVEANVPRTISLSPDKVNIVIASPRLWPINAESLKERFERLRDSWLADVAFTSSLTQIINNPHYQEIIRMKFPVLPYILQDLKAKPKQWFCALHEITGVDPIPARAAGNNKQMTAAWLKWGEQHGYI